MIMLSTVVVVAVGMGMVVMVAGVLTVIVVIVVIVAILTVVVVVIVVVVFDAVVVGAIISCRCVGYACHCDYDGSVMVVMVAMTILYGVIRAVVMSLLYSILLWLWW